MWCAAKGQTRQGIMGSHGVPWPPWRDGPGLRSEAMAQSKSLIYPWKMVIFSIIRLTSYVKVYQRLARNNWFLMIFKIIFPVKKNKPNYGGGTFVQALRSGADAMPMPSLLRLDRPVKIKGVAGKMPAFGGPCVSLIEASNCFLVWHMPRKRVDLGCFQRGREPENPRVEHDFPSCR